jgi:copper chaperone CopZ
MVDAATSQSETPVNSGTEPPSSSTPCSPSAHPGHSHVHNRPRDSHDTSSTAVEEQRGAQAQGSGESHAHAHPSGICCSKSEASIEDSWLNDLGDNEDNGHDHDHDHDVERGPPNYERVVLMVDGLQCGCCEGGISRTISRIAAIRNHQLNVVLARLTFELDTNRLSVAEVIKRLSTKTGYSFEEQVAPIGLVLEIVTSARLIPDPMPMGVSRIEFLERQPWVPTL